MSDGWNEQAKRLLKAEMQRQGYSYAALSEALRQGGIADDERNLRNKVNRGTFSAAFLIQCFVAMGSPIIRLGEPENVDIRTYVRSGAK